MNNSSSRFLIGLIWGTLISALLWTALMISVVGWIRYLRA
ncbi:hypothetical protein SAMN02799624_02219 [Paenibacillus sp. UNC496MF]|nr:hypothetical protein SAMN02799624_02219 [Paenibacillus sp. UNC496MF]